MCKLLEHSLFPGSRGSDCLWQSLSAPYQYYKEHDINQLCEVLNVPRSTYYQSKDQAGSKWNRENILEQDFSEISVNQKWVSHITYIQFQGSKRSIVLTSISHKFMLLKIIGITFLNK